MRIVNEDESMDGAFFPRDMTKEDLKDLEAIRKAYNALGSILEGRLPECPRAGIAMTRLEESAMWATKALSHR